MLRFDVLTLFPDFFNSFKAHSMIKRALALKKTKIIEHNIRDYALDKHSTCDDRPFGGGPGMVLKPEPIDRLARRLLRGKAKDERIFIHLSPKGKPLSQNLAQKFSSKKRIVLLCGHYEGIDERVVKEWATDEISVGDYILTGGELPAMVFMDAVIRLLPGVLGNKDSSVGESFNDNLLEYPQYTRPAEYKGVKVPQVLLTGNHKAIDEWRSKESLKRTRRNRPDLLKLRGKK